MVHCEESAKGEHIPALKSLDLDAPWCELSVLPNSSPRMVWEAIDQIRRDPLYF